MERRLFAPLAASLRVGNHRKLIGMTVPDLPLLVYSELSASSIESLSTEFHFGPAETLLARKLMAKRLCRRWLFHRFCPICSVCHTASFSR